MDDPVPTSNRVRAFIAIEVPAMLKDALRGVQRELDVLPRGAVRWTTPGQMHLTLRFLGDIPATEIQPVSAALQRACAPGTRLRLGALGLGAFPSAHRPRVLWVGLQGDVPELHSLHSRVLSETDGWAQSEEKVFHPHLTLGRVKTTRPADLRILGRLLADARVPELGRWVVDRVRLMRSEPRPEGARYSLLAESLLGGTSITAQAGPLS